MSPIDPLMIALCEDDGPDRDRLCRLIDAGGVPACVSMFASGEDFLSAFAPERFDLIFMDIYLPGLSGVEAIRRVRDQDAAVPVAFTTFSPDFALESYRLNAEKYMEKPVSQEAVEAMLALALGQRTARQRDVLVLGQRNPLKIPVSRLRYVEQQAHTLCFHLTGGTALKRRGRLDEVEPMLAEYPFFRCHKSYLVNLSFVQGLDRKRMVFQLREGGSAYIRRGLYYKARDAWESWLFSAAWGTGEGG